MILNRSNLITHFDGLQFQKDGLIFNQETLNNLKQKYKENNEKLTNVLHLEKYYGIFAITDTLFNKYSVTSFHYVDFKWFSLFMTAKIMHKANIEEWQGNNSFMKFSESSYQYSGDVCGFMRGDYRDCFKAIKEKEQLYQLLDRRSIELPDIPNIKIKVECGIGLNSLTKIDKIVDNPKMRIGLKYCF